VNRFEALESALLQHGVARREQTVKELELIEALLKFCLVKRKWTIRERDAFAEIIKASGQAKNLKALLPTGRKRGRPRGPNQELEQVTFAELMLHQRGHTYEQIQAMHTERVETSAIAKRVNRYAKRRGISLK